MILFELPVFPASRDTSHQKKTMTLSLRGRGRLTGRAGAISIFPEVESWHLGELKKSGGRVNSE